MPIDAIEGMRSGSRLKLRWDAFDGAKVFAGLFDQQRDEACVPLPWADGKTYCTPASEGSSVYRDDMCTQPVGHLPLGASAPTAQPYFHVERSNADCSKGAVVSLHRGTLSSQHNYFRLFAGTCIYGGSDPGRLYDLGPKIGSSELVELTPQPRVGVGRVALGYGDTSDGARVLLHLHDAELGAACEELMLARDRRSLLCLPSSRSSLSTYGDSACQQPLQVGGGMRFGLTFVPCAAKPYTLASSETCAGDFRLLRTGGRFNDEIYGNNGACTGPYPHNPGEIYYETTEPVSIARLPRQPISATGGRISPVRFSDGSIRTYTDALYDAELGTECQPTRLPDGALRCLPPRANLWSFYSDASCQAPIELVLQARGCMVAPLLPIAVEQRWTPRQTEYRAKVVGERYDGPIYQRSSTSCEQIELAADAYRTGAEVPLDRFAPATAIIDP